MLLHPTFACASTNSTILGLVKVSQDPMEASSRSLHHIDRPTSAPLRITNISFQQCDEQHPVCKNCQKSKRECLGYDPIFKQQQQPQPGLPPVSNHPAVSPSIPSNGPPPTPPSSVPSNALSLSAVPMVPTGSYSSAPTSSATPTARGSSLDHPHSIDPSLDSPAPRKHNSKACEPCRKRRVKCSGGTPCEACVVNGSRADCEVRTRC